MINHRLFLCEVNAGDALAKMGFTFWLLFYCAAFIVTSLTLFASSVSIWVSGIILACGLFLMRFGLKSRIIVRKGSIEIYKTCYVLTYKTYYAKSMRDVWFGGDWGFDEGADCIVIQLDDGREVCIGNKKEMHKLYDMLWPLTDKYKEITSIHPQ